MISTLLYLWVIFWSAYLYVLNSSLQHQHQHYFRLLPWQLLHRACNFRNSPFFSHSVPPLDHTFPFLSILHREIPVKCWEDNIYLQNVSSDHQNNIPLCPLHTCWRFPLLSAVCWDSVEDCGRPPVDDRTCQELWLALSCPLYFSVGNIKIVDCVKRLKEPERIMTSSLCIKVEKKTWESQKSIKETLLVAVNNKNWEWQY